MSLLRTSLSKAPIHNNVRLSQQIAPSKLYRSYATNRRQVTVANDDGRVNWGDLSGREKVARSTQQSFNFAIIVMGVTMTAVVGYLLFTDVFSPNSKTSYFNRSVSLIKSSKPCIEALGPANTMIFYGESFRSSFNRARVRGPTPLTRETRDEKTGVENMKMQFLVKGDRAEGWVTMHLVRRPGQMEFEYVLLALDLEGHQRIVIEGHDESLLSKSAGPAKLFGVSWGGGRSN